MYFLRQIKLLFQEEQLFISYITVANLLQALRQTYKWATKEVTPESAVT